MSDKRVMPFARGQTMFGGTPGTDGSKTFLLGSEYEFDDLDSEVSGENKPYRSGRKVTCMLVKNGTASAILPKTLCKMKKDGTVLEAIGVVDGIDASVGDVAYPADEFLPSAGVAVDDLFYVVIEGPALVITDSAGDTNISLGSYVAPGAGTPGRVVDVTTTIHGAIGRALEAVNAVSTTFLINVRRQ